MNPEPRDEAEWLLEVVDVLAVHYHWSKRQILEEIYPEEVEVYFRKIAERKKGESLEKVAELNTLLEISVAPHTRDGVGIGAVRERLAQMAKEIQDPGSFVASKNKVDILKKAMADHMSTFGKKKKKEVGADG